MNKMGCQNIDESPLYDLLSHYNRASGIELACDPVVLLGTADIFRVILPMIHGRRYVPSEARHCRKDTETILVSNLVISKHSYCRFSGSRANWRLLRFLGRTLEYHSQASRTTSPSASYGVGISE